MQKKYHMEIQKKKIQDKIAFLDQLSQAPYEKDFFLQYDKDALYMLCEEVFFSRRAYGWEYPNHIYYSHYAHIVSLGVWSLSLVVFSLLVALVWKYNPDVLFMYDGFIILLIVVVMLILMTKVSHRMPIRLHAAIHRFILSRHFYHNFDMMLEVLGYTSIKLN